ncbi:MAG: branched-chain amino acid ABC transporter permease [Deltaproteobacteria bacterium]|nr:branched-chain amino acid ABC transporter permease [Deltaproteobacteria bacterium]
MKRSYLYFLGTLIFIGVLIFPHFVSNYIIHIAVLILIWSYVSTVWAYMGRFGLVSLGHGAFLGIGAYTSGLLFNNFHLTPLVGMFIGGIAAAIVALILGYACFRFGVIGDYFALVTLALAEVIMLLIIALREFTGGSLGFTLNKMGNSFLYLSSDSKIFFYYLALAFVILSILIWKKIDKSKIYKAMRAIGEDELASASLGINVIKYKVIITIISAFLTALGGSLYGQYITYLNPHTLSGVGVSLDIAFKAILGGMFNIWGPTVGTILIVTMEETFRGIFGSHFIGVSEVLYGIALICFIIFLPKGIYGTIVNKLSKK